MTGEAHRRSDSSTVEDVWRSLSLATPLERQGDRSVNSLQRAAVVVHPRARATRVALILVDGSTWNHAFPSRDDGTRLQTVVSPAGLSSWVPDVRGPRPRPDDGISRTVGPTCSRVRQPRPSRTSGVPRRFVPPPLERQAGPRHPLTVAHGVHRPSPGTTTRVADLLFADGFHVEHGRRRSRPARLRTSPVPNIRFNGCTERTRAAATHATTSCSRHAVVGLTLGV